MYLLTQKRSYKARRCPTDCPKGLIPELFDYKGMKYCPSCGAEIIEESFDYNVFFCSHCSSVVNEHWKYCPYCGRERNERKQRSSSAMKAEKNENE